MKFPVNLTPDEDVGGFVVTFDAVPEAITEGDTIEQALAMGKEALELALSFYFEENLAVPVPLEPKPGQHVIEVSISKLRGNHL
jgi:antitoxin HicB